MTGRIVLFGGMAGAKNEDQFASSRIDNGIQLGFSLLSVSLRGNNGEVAVIRSPLAASLVSLAKFSMPPMQVLSDLL